MDNEADVPHKCPPMKTEKRKDRVEGGTFEELANAIMQVPRKDAVCTECGRSHEDGYCEKCRACLYKNSKQIPHEIHPFFECTKCHKVNFWD